MILNMATDMNTPHASTFLNSSTSLLSVCLLWHIWCGWTHLCGCWLRHIIYSRQTFLSWLFHVWVVTLDQQQEEDTVNRPGNKQYTACVCVCVGLELHNDTDLLPHCCILVHGWTHTHTLSGYGCWGGFPALTDTHQINYVLGWPKLKKTYKKCVCCFSQNSKCCSRALLRFWSPPPWYA